MVLDKIRDMALDLVCIVVDRERTDKVGRVLEKEHSFFNLVVLGKGTANSRILSYLGLGQHDKSVFLAIMPTSASAKMLEAINREMQLEKPGHGIAFKAAVQGGCYHKPVQFKKDEESGDETVNEASHDLIMVTVNRGFTEEVMDSARAAGATGGTVLHARGCGLAGAEKFFGVTIQPEKELIMIVADSGKTCAIMASIADNNGPGTDASAVSFSMPLSGVNGMCNKVAK